MIQGWAVVVAVLSHRCGSRPGCLQHELHTRPQQSCLEKRKTALRRPLDSGETHGLVPRKPAEGLHLAGHLQTASPIEDCCPLKADLSPGCFSRSQALLSVLSLDVTIGKAPKGWSPDV